MNNKLININFIFRHDKNLVNKSLDAVIERQMIHENETFAYTIHKVVQNIYFIISPNGSTWKKAYRNFRMVDDIYRWKFAYWYVRPKSFIYEPLEKFILESHQHGILDHLRRKYFPQTKKIEPDGPKVLTFSMLSAGFYLWFMCVIISIIIFFLEIIVHWMRKGVKNMNIVSDIRIN